MTVCVMAKRGIDSIICGASKNRSPAFVIALRFKMR
jgi:hypothetical protein